MLLHVFSLALLIPYSKEAGIAGIMAVIVSDGTTEP